MSALTPKPCPECTGLMIPHFSPSGACLYCPRCQKNENEFKADPTADADLGDDPLGDFHGRNE